MTNLAPRTPRALPPFRVRPGAAVAFALLTLLVGTGVLPARVAHASPLGYTLAGALAALTVLTAVGLSEWATARAARRGGQQVDRLEVGFFGPASRLSGAPATPGALARTGLATPATLGAVGGGVLLAAVAVTAAGAPLVGGALGWAGRVTVLLAAAGLLPAGSLPGGRLLTAALWRRRGALPAARVATARVGRAVGVLLLAAGAALFLTVGGIGLWVALLGLFLRATSSVELMTARTQTALAGLTVADLATQPVTGPGWLSIDAFVDKVGLPAGSQLVAVLDWSGDVAGVVGARELAAVPADDRSEKRVLAVARPRASLPVVRPDEPLLEVAPRLTVPGGGVALVVDDEGAFRGILTAADLRWAVDAAPLRDRVTGRLPHRGQPTADIH